MTDFSGTNSLIFRQPLKTDSNDYNQLNGKVMPALFCADKIHAFFSVICIFWLLENSAFTHVLFLFSHPTAPDFVHSFEYEDFVFFFFRETAVEYMNCGKRVYSRVARVCKGDRGGGQARFRYFWTSFLKSRLNCSVPGEYPFYFDEIREYLCGI